MSFFKRLFKMGESEAHSALDKLEDPIKLTEQGIRDLKTNLDQSMQGLAELKALAIRSRRDHDMYSEQSRTSEQKAIMLLQKAETGQIDPAEADRLAGEMLRKKEEADQHVARLAKDVVSQENSVSKMNANIQTLKSKVSTYENELRSLKARAKVSDATKKINKQLANVDSSSTVAMLERMKEKVAQDEALAEGYAEIAGQSRSVEDEVDKALGSTSSSASLLELKSRLGLAQKSSTPPPADQV
jgi:phage shock protein A